MTTFFVDIAIRKLTLCFPKVILFVPHHHTWSFICRFNNDRNVRTQISKIYIYIGQWISRFYLCFKDFCFQLCFIFGQWITRYYFSFKRFQFLVVLSLILDCEYHELRFCFMLHRRKSSGSGWEHGKTLLRWSII